MKPLISRITAPLVNPSRGDRWIPLTKGQQSGKSAHIMASSSEGHLIGIDMYIEPKYIYTFVMLPAVPLKWNFG